MGYFHTRGLRGSLLEEIINMTNEIYRKKGIALIQKIPTPIKPMEMDKETRTISLGYFEQKSTVDYIGIAQGISICFDAKETSQGSLPLQNIHKHQMDFMQDFEKHDGVSFILVYFKKYTKYYLLPFEKLKKYYDAKENGGRKSIPYSEFGEELEIKISNNAYVNYLEKLSEILEGEK
ncbi:MAG TPA: Holliday junction resolvase RecU [Clostridiales bacterium]|nr:MAG: Holliday junction resolvase RecU [Clostridiales bacterium GWD2_32_59]HAN10282.1 Holliday junction resolvase RecU [Clostridiales bacterium]